MAESSVLVIFEEDAAGEWQSDDRAMMTLAELLLIALRFESPIVGSVPKLRIGPGGASIGFTVPARERDAVASVS
jgi:hypothetical protein